MSNFIELPQRIFFDFEIEDRKSLKIELCPSFSFKSKSDEGCLKACENEDLPVVQWKFWGYFCMPNFVELPHRIFFVFEIEVWKTMKIVSNVELVPFLEDHINVKIENEDLPVVGRWFEHDFCMSNFIELPQRIFPVFEIEDRKAL